MIKKLILKDFGRNKIVNIVLFLFIVMSAFLMATGTMVVAQLANSMDAIFEVAKPPHFLQMHSGEIDQNRIDQFSQNVAYVENQETVEMLNIAASNIWYEKTCDDGIDVVTMEDNMLDNGFVVQNQNFDYLVTTNNQVAVVEDGQIGVPISYMDTYQLSIGDKVIIKDGNYIKEFVISCFVRDAQMASSMASSTRFLITAGDHEELEANTGDLEYIIEYRFVDEKYANEFQTLYTAKDSEMPTNGPAITYPLIKMLNGISGGLLAGTLVLVSLLLIAVAVINVRFTILSTIEEEQKEIGALKAIGFSKKDMRNLYLYKYRILAIGGCILGYFLGLLVNTKLTVSITQTFGECPLTLIEKLLPIFSTVIVYLLVIKSCRKILKKIDKISVVEALVYGKEEKGRSNAKCMPLRKYRVGSINQYMAIRECWIGRKNWAIVVLVFLLATMMMVIPMNLFHTFQSPDFSSDIGSSKCDIRMGIQFAEGIQEKYDNTVTTLEGIQEISEYASFATVNYGIMGEEGKEIFVVECGNYQQFPISCIEGTSPQKDGEIAISYLNAKKFNLSVGDTLTLTYKDTSMELKVCGIYQDVTSGGYTAKAQVPYHTEDVLSYTFFINLKSSLTPEEFMQQYGSCFHDVKIAPMTEYMMQTFGNLVTSFRSVAIVTCIIATLMTSLLIALFIQLRTVKEYSKCAVLAALGFTAKEINHQYMIQSGICAFFGYVFGMFASNILGEGLIGMVLSMTGVGLAGFRFVVNGWFCYLVCPVLLLLIAIYVTWQCRKCAGTACVLDMNRD